MSSHATTLLNLENSGGTSGGSGPPGPLSSACRFVRITTMIIIDREDQEYGQWYLGIHFANISSFMDLRHCDN